MAVLGASLASAQTLLWQQPYNSITPVDDGPLNALVDGNSNVFLVSSDTYQQITVSKWTKNRTLAWTYAVPAPFNRAQMAAGAVLDKDGNVILATTSPSTGSDPVPSQYVVTKIASASGSLAFQRTSPSFSASLIGVDDSKRIYLNGEFGSILRLTASGFPDLHFTPPNGSYYVSRVDAVGNIYLAGIAYGASHLFAVKLDSSGNLLWSYTRSTSDISEANCLALGADGSVFVGGDTHPSISNYDSSFLVVKLNGSTGAALWTSTYSESSTINGEIVTSIALDPTTGDAFAVGAYDGGRTIVQRLANASGTRQWIYRDTQGAYGSGSGRGVSDGSGGLLLSGQWRSSSSSPYLVRAARINGSGGAIWEKTLTHGAAKDEFGFAAAFDPGTGEAIFGAKLDGGAYYGSETAALRFSLAGDALPMLLQSTLNSNREQFIASATASDGGRAVLAYGFDIQHGEHQKAVRFNADGTVRWAFTIPPIPEAQQPTGAFSKIAIGPDGSVALGGAARDVEGYDDCMVANLDKDTGAMLWRTSTGGPDHRSDEINALAFDGNLDIVVGGSEFSFATSDDPFLWKIKGTTGATKWARVYPSNQGGAVGAIDLTKNGTIAAAASIYDFPRYGLVIKVNAGNGNVVKSTRISGPTNGDTSISAMLRDSGGNLVCTGTTALSPSDPRAYVAKVMDSTGALKYTRTVSDANSPYARSAFDRTTNTLFVVHGNSAVVTAIPTKTGKESWTQPVTSPPYSIVVTLMTATPDHHVIIGGYNNSDGKCYLQDYGPDGTQAYRYLFNDPTTIGFFNDLASDGLGNPTIVSSRSIYGFLGGNGDVVFTKLSTR